MSAIIATVQCGGDLQQALTWQVSAALSGDIKRSQTKIVRQLSRKTRPDQWRVVRKCLIKRILDGWEVRGWETILMFLLESVDLEQEGERSVWAVARMELINFYKISRGGRQDGKLDSLMKCYSRRVQHRDQETVISA